MTFYSEEILKESWEFSQKILPEVSRTFALNINKLKGETRKAVLSGYLILRMADCLEDSPFYTESQKAQKLIAFSKIFNLNTDIKEAENIYRTFKDFRTETPAEAQLMVNGLKVFNVFFSLLPGYRKAMILHIAGICRGMARFQLKKASSQKKIYQLSDTGELKEYCYYAAGMVGEMLTDIFSIRSSVAPLKKDLNRYARAFGEGLQVTNIAKDWKKDNDRGWLYVPKNLFDVDRKEKANEEKIKIYLASIAAFDFGESMKYIRILPDEAEDFRLFCIIPLLLALATLLNLFSGKSNKISRAKVYKLMDESRRCATSPEYLDKIFKKFNKKLKKHIVENK